MAIIVHPPSADGPALRNCYPNNSKDYLADNVPSTFKIMVSLILGREETVIFCIQIKKLLLQTKSFRAYRQGILLPKRGIKLKWL